MKRQLRRCIDFAIQSKTKIYVLMFALPVVILGAFFSALDLTRHSAFFMAVFLLNYLTIAFALFLVMNRGIPPKRLARSPFYFIDRLNIRDYWDAYQQPTKQLVGAEIGVAEGRNAKAILNFLNIKQLVLVDAWKGYDEFAGSIWGDSPGIELNRGDSFFEEQYQEVKITFADSANVRIIRELSVDGAALFDDEYFDFVYLDGDHCYEAVRDDLEAWYPKLKRFGVMCGDDYGHPSGLGVIEAVSEFAFKNHLLVGYGEDNQFWFVKF